MLFQQICLPRGSPRQQILNIRMLFNGFCDASKCGIGDAQKCTTSNEILRFLELLFLHMFLHSFCAPNVSDSCQLICNSNYNGLSAAVDLAPKTQGIVTFGAPRRPAADFARFHGIRSSVFYTRLMLFQQKASPRGSLRPLNVDIIQLF